jgi:hypothetical protein
MRHLDDSIIDLLYSQARGEREVRLLLAAFSRCEKPVEIHQKPPTAVLSEIERVIVLAALAGSMPDGLKRSCHAG